MTSTTWQTAILRHQLSEMFSWQDCLEPRTPVE